MKAESLGQLLHQLWRAYRMRWKRRYFLARAIRRRRQLEPSSLRVTKIGPEDILLFSCVRNEITRLPYFLEHHRKLGVGHFLFVDNDSTDGTFDFLSRQPDVSLWTTEAGYKLSRFGVDWLTWLQFRHGAGHWCLTLDADELFFIPYHGVRTLADLTRWLDDHGAKAMGAMMLDLYPKGPVGDQDYRAGQDPAGVLCWYDGHGYTQTPRPELSSVILRGGPRARKYFSQSPERAPTLNKVPLVRWRRKFVYMTSTHVILPPRLNTPASATGANVPSAVLLHTKFLPEIVAKSAEEKYRAEHFSNSAAYDAYYDALAANPDFWTDESQKFEGWEKLEKQGLMSRGDW